MSFNKEKVTFIKNKLKEFENLLKDFEGYKPEDVELDSVKEARKIAEDYANKLVDINEKDPNQIHLITDMTIIEELNSKLKVLGVPPEVSQAAILQVLIKHTQLELENFEKSKTDKYFKYTQKGTAIFGAGAKLTLAIPKIFSGSTYSAAKSSVTTAGKAAKDSPWTSFMDSLPYVFIVSAGLTFTSNMMSLYKEITNNKKFDSEKMASIFSSALGALVAGAKIILGSVALGVGAVMLLNPVVITGLTLCSMSVSLFDEGVAYFSNRSKKNFFEKELKNLENPDIYGSLGKDVEVIKNISIETKKKIYLSEKEFYQSEASECLGKFFLKALGCVGLALIVGSLLSPPVQGLALSGFVIAGTSALITAVIVTYREVRDFLNKPDNKTVFIHDTQSQAEPSKSISENPGVSKELKNFSVEPAVVAVDANIAVEHDVFNGNHNKYDENLSHSIKPDSATVETIAAKAYVSNADKPIEMIKWNDNNTGNVNENSDEKSPDVDNGVHIGRSL